MAFGNKLFGYSSGAIDLDEGWCSQYSNHALTITGYTPGPETTTEIGNVTYCRKRWAKDYPDCRYAGEEVWGWGGKYCCVERRKKIESSEGATFKIMNQWGTDWGDDGFLYVNAREGDGVCNMNTEVWLPLAKTLN